MRRPRVKIPLTNIDWLTEIVGAVFFILMIVYPWHYFDQLPETIPIHYDGTGNPNGFGSKNELWNLVLVGSVLYLGITILNFFPHWFNYMTTITKENAAEQYRLSIIFMRRIKVLITIMFFEITYGTVQIALFNKESINAWFLPVSLIVLIAIIVDYFHRALKKVTN